MIELRGLSSPKPDWQRLNEITTRLAAKDATIWGEAARAEAQVRLDWVDLPERSWDLLPELDALAAWSRELGHQRFILCGMGGSSLAPEVIAATYGRDLVVLDSTDPNQIHHALALELSRSCIIIASKSGSTIETAAQRALFEERLNSSGLDPREHMVIVTDPDSPLETSARAAGLRTITANPRVGGRFSALSAFGLVPAALIGVDISLLLDDATAAASTFVKADSPPVRMAAYLASSEARFQKFFDKSSELPGIADWIEQLIAESTGKDGRGVLPVIVDSPSDTAITFDGSSSISVLGPLGAQFIFWEWVTALLCYLLEVDPFNQPNVAESKERTGAILTGGRHEAKSTVLNSGHLQFFTDLSGGSISEILRGILSRDYLAIMAYLDRNSDQEICNLRSILAGRFEVPITFGWGPRFLHSTGQFHKGGPLIGSFIQITGAVTSDIPVPGAPYTFAGLIAAQADGDRDAIKARDLPFLRIHLTERKEGIRELLELAKQL